MGRGEHLSSTEDTEGAENFNIFWSAEDAENGFLIREGARRAAKNFNTFCPRRTRRARRTDCNGRGEGNCGGLAGEGLVGRLSEL